MDKTNSYSNTSIFPALNCLPLRQSHVAFVKTRHTCSPIAQSLLTLIYILLFPLTFSQHSSIFLVAAEKSSAAQEDGAATFRVVSHDKCSAPGEKGEDYWQRHTHLLSRPFLKFQSYINVTQFSHIVSPHCLFFNVFFFFNLRDLVAT